MRDESRFRRPGLSAASASKLTNAPNRGNLLRTLQYPAGSGTSRAIAKSEPNMVEGSGCIIPVFKPETSPE